ncbi:MAG: bifunctional DNA-formamidopyrimidine glycosylase/DNA-(apurinic or apyrimidinic site) lyase [Acidimicrobiales bacterium]
MPELPEVETVRRGLDAELVGRTIEAVTATGLRTVRRLGGAAGAGLLVRRATGRRLLHAERHGKFLLLRLDTGDVVVIHLGMSGQLRAVPAGTPAAPHTHVVLAFEGGTELRFVDPRTFGEVFVTGPDVPELAHLGPDALAGVPDAAALGRLLAGRRRRIKPALLDQQVIAGIGNIYADESLWAARLHPDRAAGELSRPALRRLHAAIHATLLAGIAHRGSSLADEQYRDLWGGLGGYQHHHEVHAREGKPCSRCGTPIRRARDLGRSTYWCPRCQRGGIPGAVTGLR